MYPGRKPCLLDAGTFHNFRPKNSRGNSCIGGLGIWALRRCSGVLDCLGSVSLSNRWSMDPSTSLRDPGRKPCFLDAGTFHNFRPKNSWGNSCIGGLGIWTLRLTLRDPGLLRIGELVEPSINGPFDFALRLRLRLTLRGPAILFCYIGFSV